MKRKLVIIACFIALNLSTTWAQKQIDPEKMASFQTSEMTTELDLSESQQEKVARINLESARDMKLLIESEGSKFGKMGEMRAIQKNKNRELEQVLNEDQMEYYTEELAPKMRKEMKKSME